MSLKSPHQPRKRFGQNFLQDPFVVQKIIEAIDPKENDKIIEIGPGLGALTTPLLDRVFHLEVIEIDRDLAHQLKASFSNAQQLTVHVADALKFDFHTIIPKTSNKKKMRIIGNLPYNISTPLLFHLFKFSHWIEDMHFMLQKEVVERLTARPRHKTYGRLSIMAQYYCDIEALFTVEPHAFFPSPKVDSAFIFLKPHLFPPFPARNITLLQEITRTAFNQRRKTLSNALKSYLKTEDFIHLHIDPTLRPEALSIKEFVALSNFIDERLNAASEDHTK